MVHIVTCENQATFAPVLAGMFHDRKRVFVDWLKWSVPIVAGQYEMDQFDGPDAVYLVEYDRKSRRHLASVRLLPSLKPHLLLDVFPELCDGAVPRGEEIMELTRLCVTPDVDKPQAVRLMNHMFTAAVEYALLFGVEQYTGVSHRPFLDLMLAAGWGAKRLGAPREIDGQVLGSIVFPISPATMRECRRRFGYRLPVLEFPAIADAA